MAAAFEVFSGVQPYEEQQSPSPPGSPNSQSNPYETTLARLRSNSSSRHTSPPTADPASPPPAWKRRPSQIARARTNSTGATTQPLAVPPTGPIARTSPTRNPSGSASTTSPGNRRYPPSSALRMTSSGESALTSSEGGTVDLVTPLATGYDGHDDFAPPNPQFGGRQYGHTPGSSTTSLRSMGGSDAYAYSRRHSAAYSIPTNDGADMPDLSNPFRQADERPLDTVRRMSRMVERKDRMERTQSIVGRPGKPGLQVQPMTLNDMIWPTVAPAPADYPTPPSTGGLDQGKRSKSTVSLASLSSKRHGRGAKSTPASPSVRANPGQLPSSLDITRMPGTKSRSGSVNTTASSQPGTYAPMSRDLLLALSPREGGYAVAAGFGYQPASSMGDGPYAAAMSMGHSDRYPMIPPGGYNIRQERSVSESRANEFGMNGKGKHVARYSVDGSGYDPSAYGQPNRPGLQSADSSVSDSNSTSTNSLVDEPNSYASTPSAPPPSLPAADSVTRPSPLSQAVTQSDDISEGGLAGAEDVLTMRSNRGNGPAPASRTDPASMRSSPSQSSPLAGPPLATTPVAPAPPVAPAKTKKQLEKEQKERAAAEAKQREKDAKERKRVEKLRKEEAKQKAKSDKVQAKEQKKQAEKDAEQRIKAAQASKVAAVRPAPVAAAAPVATSAPTTTAVSMTPGAPSTSPTAPPSAFTPQNAPAPQTTAPATPPAKEPKLERRRSLVAILGRQRKQSVTASDKPPALPAVPQTPETAKSSPTVRSMGTPRVDSPAPSQGSLTKSKSSVWGTFKRKLSMAPASPSVPSPPPKAIGKSAPPERSAAPAPPPPAPSQALPPTPIRPEGYSNVAPSTYDPVTANPRRMSVSEAQQHPLPAGAAPSAMIGASPSMSPSRDAYQSLSVRPPSVADDSATIDLARVTSLPQSIATAEASSESVRPSTTVLASSGMSRQTTCTSVDRTSLQRIQSADKNLPSLPPPVLGTAV